MFRITQCKRSYSYLKACSPLNPPKGKWESLRVWRWSRRLLERRGIDGNVSFDRFHFGFREFLPVVKNHTAVRILARAHCSKIAPALVCLHRTLRRYSFKMRSSE